MVLKDIVIQLQENPWQPTSNISRPFVKYASPVASSGATCRYTNNSSWIDLSVIIPTVDAHRGGYFEHLLHQIRRQDYKSFEVIVVKGDRRQGRAINTAVAIARGKYILTLDDDTSLSDPMTFDKLVAVMERYPEIGIAGGNNVIPADTKLFVRRVMHELPRRSWDPVEKLIDSDLAEHPCMIMRIEEFKWIGGENELIPRGLDPYLRQEFRKIPKRVVVVPGVIYHHLPPDNFSKLLRQFYRNGRQAAFTNRNYPQWVIETPPEHGQFKVKKSFTSRLLRFPMRLVHALVTGKPIWFLCEVIYAFGFIRGYLDSEELS